MRNSHRFIRPSLGWLAVVALLTVPVLTLSGAVDMFLRLDQIKGESRDITRAGDIDVLAWSWGASNSGTTHTGTISAGKANVQDISVTKFIDKSSPTLLLNTMNGTHIASGELVVRKAGLKQPLEYLKIEMKDILITSLSTGGSGGEDRLTENVSLNFGRYRLTYTPENQDGTVGSPVVVEWNIAENSSSF